MVKEINIALVRPLAIAAGFLGLIQGVIWTTICALCIFCYFEVIAGPVDSGSYAGNIYQFYLSRNYKQSDNVQIKPLSFFIFMWIYETLSVLWCGLSAVIAWATIRKKWQYKYYLFGGWSTITFIITIVDLVFTILLAIDFKKINDSKDGDVKKVCAGMVMSIAARGYLLWFINLIFAVVMMKFALQQLSHMKTETPQPAIINGFEEANTLWYTNGNSASTSSLWPTVQKDEDKNQSFVPTNYSRELFAKTNENRSTFLHPISTNAINHQSNQFQSRLANNETENNKNLFLNENSGPFIPEPDYSPPSTPSAGLKSALKSTSSYQYQNEANDWYKNY